MGRHSVAYIDARQGFSAQPAVAFVGRVGALALALGIGAAVAGGTGPAHADESAGGDTGGAQSSPSPSATGDAADDTAAAATTTTDDSAAKPTDPGSIDVPTMQPGTTTSAADKPDDEELPAALPEMIAELPEKITDTLHGAPAPATKRPKDPPLATNTPAATGTTDATPYARAMSDTAEAVGDIVAPASVEPPPAAHAPSRDLVAAAVVVPPAPQLTFVNPVVTVVSGLLSALGFPPSAGVPDGTPTAPMPLILGVLQLIRREIENITLQLTWPLTTTSPALTNANPAIAPGPPTPADEMPTAYGDIGKWMLQSNGQIANFGGVPHDGRILLEAVNIIVVDPTSSSPAEASAKLNSAMFWAGFPAQPIHSTGFLGTIDDVTYGQQPNLPLLGYSNNLFILPNDHGRIFGPDPVETATGYVWSGAFSTEALTIYELLPTHEYVSSNTARNALAMRLIFSGRATYGGMVPLDNAYNTETTTTGNHDGYAVVLVLR